MSSEAIRRTQEAWGADPDKAKGTPAVQAWTEGAQAMLQAGSFTWKTDLPAPLGGGNSAPSPTALLLSALAGCAAVFIRDTLAPQMGIEVRSVKAVARCATDARGLLGMPGSAPDLERMELVVEIDSPAGDEQVRGLYEVWRRRCPVYLALTKPTPVATTLEIARGRE